MKILPALFIAILFLMNVTGVEASQGAGIVETFSTIILLVLFLVFGCAGLGYFARNKNYVESTKAP